MRLIKEETHLDFMGKARLAAIISALALIAGLVGYFTMGGLNYGIDFKGGTLVQVRFEESVDIDTLRGTLSGSDLGTFSLQSFGEDGGNEFLITLAGAQGDGQAQKQEALTDRNISARVETLLKEHHPKFSIRRVESVGPKVGEELKQSAVLAILLSLLLILAYTSFRFQWRYGVAAIVALFHDVLIVMAAFVFSQHEISLPVVAAVLTVAGYSINDTIVIFDRLRENIRRFHKKSAEDIINESINQTLSRTLLTSGTTIFVVLALFIFGGEIIRDFSFALLVGVVVGTYSSIFIASPMFHTLLRWFPTKV